MAVLKVSSEENLNKKSMMNNSQKSGTDNLCISATKLQTSIQSAQKLSESKFSSSKANQSIPQISKLPKSDAKAPCRRKSAAKSPDHSWHTIHRQFTEYGRNAKEWLRKCQLLLPQIEKQKIWHKKRFHNIYDYAAKLAGMNHDQVNECLRVLHKAEIFPSLMKVIEQKGINSVKPVLGIINSENVGMLTEKAMTMNKNTLEVFVRYVRQNNFQITGLPRKPAQSVNLQNLQSKPQSTLDSSISPNVLGQPIEPQFMGPPKVTLVMQLNPETADQLQKIKGQGNWDETIDKLLEIRQEKIDQQKPEIVEEASRPIPAAIEKYVLAKTNSTCAFPGCYKSYEILHHTNRFAMYHTHDPDSIVPLCKAHERLAHLGLIGNENQSPQYWKLRAQPDYDDPKYEIDRVVEKYRQPSKIVAIQKT